MKKRFLVLSAATMLAAQDPGEIELVSDDIILDEQSTQTESELPPLEKMPVQTGFVDALYPEEFQKQGIEGVTRLNLLVNDSGRVEESSVIGGFNPTLDSLAREASLKFAFTPAEASGKPVSVYIEYEYKFSIDEVVQQLEEYVNCQGVLAERGTKNLLADVPVAAVFSGKSYEGLSVPLDRYLEKIGEFEGQTLDNGMLITTTDSLGRFSFKSLPAGEITLRIPHTGYEILETKETISQSEQVDLKLWLSKLSYNDYTVTSYYTGEEKEVSRRQISVNEIKKVAGLGGDAVKVVQAMPGVARPSFASGEVVIRGSYTYDSKFNLDGIEIPLLYHFGGLKSTYNGDGLAGLDFYPGGFGSSYGNAIGGVVDLKTKVPSEDRIHGKVDASTLDASFRVDGPIIPKKLSFMATARRSFFGEILQGVMKSLEESGAQKFGTTISPHYWDYTTRFDVTPSEDHRIAITSFGSYDSLAVLFQDRKLGSDELTDESDRVKTKTFFNIAGASWEYAITDQLKNKLSIFHRYNENNIAILGFFRQKFNANGVQFRNNLAWSFNDKMTLNGGVDGYAGNVDIELDILTEKGISRDIRNDWAFAQIGGFANLEWKPTDKLLIIPGIRYDYYEHLNYDGSLLPEFANYGDWNKTKYSGDPAFRLNGRYKLNDKNLIKGAVGTYNQEPQPQGQVTHEKWGNPKLGSTKAAHYVAGYEWNITDLLMLDAQGYFNSQWDISQATDSTDIAKIGESTPPFLDDGKGRTYGLELMLRHYQGERFFGWVAYTLSRSERWNDSENRWALFDKDQTQNIQVVGSWRLRKNWELGSRIRYTTGNPTTPVLGRTENLKDHFMSPVYGEVNSTRMDPFFQIDIRVEKKYILKKTILTTYIDLQNASYPIYKSPENPDWDDFYIEQKFISMPIIPAIGLSWEF